MLVSLLSGCATVHVGAFTVWADSWGRDSEAVKKQASLDRKCPTEQLQLTLLSVHPSGDAREIGVDGCGPRGVYVRADSGWSVGSKTADPK